MVPSALIVKVPFVGCIRPSVDTDPVSIVVRKPKSLLSTSMTTKSFGGQTALSFVASINGWRHMGCIVVPTSSAGLEVGVGEPAEGSSP